MSIADTSLERKSQSALTGVVVVCAVAALCVAVSSFALGRLSGIYVTRTPVRIATTTAPAAVSQASGLFVGSRQSDKYHYPWCPGARRIDRDNLVSFSSRSAAREAGYSAAQNCNGLEQ
jgi:hypothetical protein